MFSNSNKNKSNQTASPDKYPQGYFKDKHCRICDSAFTPKAPSELYCCDECKDIAFSNKYLLRTYNITLDEYNRLY